LGSATSSKKKKTYQSRDDKTPKKSPSLETVKEEFNGFKREDVAEQTTGLRRRGCFRLLGNTLRGGNQREP